MKRVEGKVAVVTGGVLGLGRAISLLLAKEGAKIAVVDIKDEDGQKVVKEIQSLGGIAKYWHLDTTKEQQAKSVFAEIAKEFGKIDVLVNNAGISGVDKPTHQVTEEEWNRVMDINVKGVFLCTKHAIPYMLKNGSGSIINISSIYGLVGGADLPPYHASKGAVRLMSKTDAMIYAKDKIRVNSVHPGFIWTAMVEELASRTTNDVAAYKKQLDSLHPIGHVGEPSDIANGVLFLASDESKFMTGSELVIDGGYTAH